MMNETKEEVLQTYFDRLSVLLIDRNLIALSNKSNSSTITFEEQELLDSSLDIIRTRTLSILRMFENDAERKASVINFLIETEIIGKSKLTLYGADLSGADLSGANLQGANLHKVNFQGANLQGVNFQGAKLGGMVNLEGANLQEANLQKANLVMANLKGANLEGTNLEGANLYHANLQEANLYMATLEGSNLVMATLEGTNLEGADLSKAELFMADLKDIKWNSETVWPDNSEFTDAINIPEELKKELGITP